MEVMCLPFRVVVKENLLAKRQGNDFMNTNTISLKIIFSKDNQKCINVFDCAIW
jgi:hypothetical protein